MSRNNDLWPGSEPLSEDERRRLEHDEHRHRLADSEQAVHRLFSEQMRLGMRDQCTADEDGAPDLPSLFAQAKREGKEVATIRYLRRCRGVSDEELEPLLRRLGSVSEFPLKGETSTEDD